jgi:hypothetical protein
MSISAILPRETVKPMTATGCPATVATTPADPFTRAGRIWAEAWWTRSPWSRTAARAVGHHGKIWARGSPVGPQYEIRVEDGDEHGEVAVARQPLGRGQCLQHHLQRQPDRVGQQHLILGAQLVRAADHRVGHVHAHGLFTPRFA